MADGRGGARAGAGAKPRTVTDATGEAYVLYSKARAKKETHNARIAEMEERKISGELLDRRSVEQDADMAARTVKNSLLGIPERLASILVGRTEKEILQELRKEISITLKGISDELDTAN